MNRSKRFIAGVVFLVATLFLVCSSCAEDQSSLFTVDMRLSRKAVDVRSDGSWVFIGDKETVTASVLEKAAIATCVNVKGEVLWTYEENFLPGTNNYFYDVSVLENDDIIVLHWVTHPDYSVQIFALQIRDGQLLSRTELEDSVESITSVNGQYIAKVRATVQAQTEDYIYYYPKLTAYNKDWEEVWTKEYNHSFNLVRIVPTAEGFYGVGFASNIDSGKLLFSEYCAFFDEKGDIIWDYTLPTTDSRYEDAVVMEDGGIVAVGGSYESGDGLVAPVAHAARFDQNGRLIWQKEFSLDGCRLEAVALTDIEILVAGTNYIEENQVLLAVLDTNGSIVDQRRESLGSDLFLPDRIVLYPREHSVYLIVTAYTNSVEEMYSRDKPLPISHHFKTMVKFIQ